MGSKEGVDERGLAETRGADNHDVEAEAFLQTLAHDLRRDGFEADVGLVGDGDLKQRSER